MEKLTRIDNKPDLNNYEQRVEKKAYELYVNRGYKDGFDWDDWYEAQKQVVAEMSTIDRDCIRSESFYKTAHQLKALPSEMEAKNIR